MVTQRVLYPLAVGLLAAVAFARLSHAQRAPTHAERLEIATALRPRRAALRACYEGAPSAERTAVRGVHTVTVEIAGDGHVATVLPTPPQPTARTLGACVLRELASVRLVPAAAHAPRTFVFTREALRALLAADPR